MHHQNAVDKILILLTPKLWLHERSNLFTLLFSCINAADNDLTPSDLILLCEKFHSVTLLFSSISWQNSGIPQILFFQTSNHDCLARFGWWMMLKIDWHSFISKKIRFIIVCPFELKERMANDDEYSSLENQLPDFRLIFLRMLIEFDQVEEYTKMDLFYSINIGNLLELALYNPRAISENVEESKNPIIRNVNCNYIITTPSPPR